MDDSGTDTFNIARSNTTLFSMSSNVTTFSNDLTVSKSSDVYVTASTSSGRVGLVLSPSLGNDAYIYMSSKWLAGYDASAVKYKISYNDFGSVDAITIDDTTGLVTIANLSTGSLSGTDLDVNNLTVNGQGFFRGTSSSIDGVSADVGALIVGAIGGGQIQIDYDDIQAVNSGAATTLYLNYYGGDVSIASNGGTASFGGAMNVNGSVNFSGTLGVSGLITASGGLSLPSGDFTVGSGFAVRAPTGRFDNLNKYLTSQILVSDVMRMSGSTQLQFQDTGSIISTTGGGEFHIRSDRTTKLYTTNTNSLVLGVSNGTQLTLTNTTLVYSGFSNVFSVSGTSNLSTLNVSGVATINNILNVNGNTEFAIPVTINQSFSTSTTKTVYGLNVDFNGNQDSGAGGGDTLAGLGIRSYVHGTNTNSANNVVQNVAFFAEVTGGLRGALAAGTPANVAFYANINGNSSSDSYALYAPGQGHIYLGQGNISIASGNLTVGGTGEGIVTCNGINTNDVGSTNRFAYAQTTSTGSGTIAFSTLGVNSFAVRAVIVYVSTGADNWTLDNSVSFNAVSGNITGLAANTVHKVVVIHNS